LESQLSTRSDRDQIAASVQALSVPCDPSWLMARVMALLAPYFTANIPEAVRRIEAGDWLVALSDRPQWAIEKACRWWKGDENPDHRRKPIEGDIADRVRFEMGILAFGAMKVREYDAGYAKRIAEPEEAPPTPEQMEQRRAFANGIMSRFGYLKAMPKPPRPQSSADRNEPPPSPEEIAETMAVVNANAAARQAESDRRASVAAEIRAKGWGVAQ